MVGTVASASMPMAISARLHAAITWKVPMWLRLPHQPGPRTTQRPGRSSTTCGYAVRKYGALRLTAALNRREPNGSRVAVFHSR